MGGVDGSRQLGLTVRAIVAAMVGGALASGVASVPVAVAQEQLPVTVESNARTGYVSGGDVLVRVTRPVGVRAENVRVSVAGRDVSHAFSEQPDGSLLGLVTGLPGGRSTIVARTGRAPGSTLP